ncbi:MAG: ABC transporter permease [Saprospiraceae bacterium]|nr:ABC transporter permease [Saprospiraceae bacterium]
MSIYKFILKSLWFFRKQHIAVFLGTLFSTAVLTGALIIGDSVKLSLKKLVDSRLGEIEYALSSNDRFVRSQLADEISEDLNISTAACLIVDGITIKPESESRLNRTQILGVDNRFWQLSNVEMPDLGEDEAIISSNISQKLSLKIGDEILLRIRKADVIPLNAPFVSERELYIASRFKIIAIADNNSLGRFSLKSNQLAPNNVFVSMEFLAKKLSLEGKSNLILVGKGNDNQSLEILNESIEANWKIADAALKIREVNSRFEVLSERIFIDKPITDAINNLDKSQEPILSYMVNAIKKDSLSTPYSFVAAATYPIIPKDLKDDEIIINQWLAEDINAQIGDSISLEYFIIGALRKLEEKSSNFIVKDIIRNQSEFIDSTLMPDFPGLADAESCDDWQTGIPVDLEKIRDKDEKYWNEFKGTPKAYITVKKGNELWENKYGAFTSIRFKKSKTSVENFKADILKELSPKDLNLEFISVRESGVKAASNSVDFGELFLSLSFFVILAGFLLTVLLYSLNIESRNIESGILAGLGFSKKQIIKLRISETLIITVLGGIAGAFIGILYNDALLYGLNSIWQGAVRTNTLEVFVLPKTVIIGALSGIIIAIIAIFFVSRKKLKQPIALLIKDENISSKLTSKRKRLFSKLFAFLALTTSILILVYSFASSVDSNASLFLSSGALFIIGLIALINIFLSSAKKKKHTSQSIFKLAFKNAGRNRNRSIATIVLLALGVFTILITASNRKTFYGDENSRSSGTGGYSFWAESTIPILHDLNTERGKSKLGLSDKEEFDGVKFMQFHKADGEDASCLNLNQVQNPQILGVDAVELNQRKSFSFAKLLDEVNQENPWLELNKNYDGVIPAFADQTVITWGLLKKVGDTLFYKDEFGEDLKLLLVGGLASSVFQGNILISDSIFLKHFPSVSGSKIMLIDAPQKQKDKVRETLQMYFFDYGIEITPTEIRLAEFYSITNTYLMVFMMLGGLGLIIGTLGLGIIIFRNLLERKQEIALLLAIGFKKTQIFKLIFIENLFLLIAGMITGIAGAIIGILPSILSPSFSIPGTLVFYILAIILASGILWIYFPARKVMKGNLVKGLRKE